MRRIGFSLAAAILTTVLLTQACASRYTVAQLPEVSLPGFWLQCQVIPMPGPPEEAEVGETGGVIPIRGGHSLTVPPGAIEGDPVRFQIVVPSTPFVQVNIITIPNNMIFTEPLTLTLNYKGRGCGKANPVVPDTQSLSIYRITPNGRVRLPKTAAIDSTVSTQLLSLSTFALGG